MDFNTTYHHHELIPKTTYHLKRIAVVLKKEQYYVRRTRRNNNVVQTIPFVRASRDDDTRSCPDTAVCPSGLHPNRSSRILEEKCSRLSYLLFGQDRKIQEKNTNHMDKAKNSEIRFRRKVKNSSVALRGRTACFAWLKPSLVVAGQSAVQQTPSEYRVVLLELLLRRCIYPDVWLKQNTLLLRACAVEAQNTIHTGLKRDSFLPFR